MDDGVLGRDVGLGLAAVTGQERVVDVVVVAPPPALDVLERVEFARVGLVVRPERQDKLGRLVRFRGRTRLSEFLTRAAVERLEARDEVALSLGPVRAKARVLWVREEGDGPDVVRGGPAGLLVVGRLVPRARLEFGDAEGGARGESARKWAIPGIGKRGNGLLHTERDMLVVVPVCRVAGVSRPVHVVKAGA